MSRPTVNGKASGTLVKRVAITILAVLLAGAGWIVYRINDHPSVEPYRSLFLAPAGEPAGHLRVTFMGVSTLLLTDGGVSLLIDGFFSRPGKLPTLFGKVEPDPDLIVRSLERAEISRLAAVIVVHSHYDHVMDAPEVAKRTAARLVGSESTANVGRGAYLQAHRMIVVGDDETLNLGRYRVRLIKTSHFPHGQAMGEIVKPLVPPARATDYLEGGSYSVLVEHGERSLLIQASAGFVEGALDEVRADVVFLGLAGLGTRDDAYRDAYWREVVDAVEARRVIPIHWDDFTLPLDEPLRPLPALLDDFGASMEFVLERAKQRGIDVKMLPTWQSVDPFEGL